MYKCYDCGYVFEEPKQYSEDKTPGGAFEGGSFIDHYTGCPSCGGAYDEAAECEWCGEWSYRSLMEYTDEGLLCNLCLEEKEIDDYEDSYDD